MEMEQEIESIFENITEPPAMVEHVIPTSAYIFRYLHFIVCLVGLLLTLLLIFVILKSKQMKTRTNLVFLNRCIYDSLYVSSDIFYPILYYFIGDAVYQHPMVHCFQTYTTGLFEMAMWGFTLMLLSSRLMNSKELTTRAVLSFGNLTVLVYYAAHVIQCLQKCSSKDVVEGVVALTLGVLLVLATLTKDINRCRRNASIPISKDSNFRLNIARILTYNWSLCFVFTLVHWHFVIWRFFQMCMSLNAIFTFIYVFLGDEEYKTRILKLLKFDFDLDEDDGVVENCVYAKTTRKNQNVVVDFKPLDDVVVDEP